MTGGYLKRLLRIHRNRPYSTYTDKYFTKFIDKKQVNFVFELGSRDLVDAGIVSKYYDARVFSFECNPESIQKCHENLARVNNVVLIEKAVWNETGTIKFFPVDSSYDEWDPETKSKNTGASSCFRATNDVHYEILEQSETTVSAVRLDEFCRDYDISSIDMLCMDLQGAEYHALKGLGEILKTVKYIITEAEIVPLYEDQHLIDDIVRLLREFNFELIVEQPCIGRQGDIDPFSNYLFVNRSLV